MAYLSKDRKNGEVYLRIMESVIIDGKKTKRTLYSLGKLSDYTPEMLQRIGSQLFVLGGGDLRDLIGSNTEELGRFNYGYFQCVTKVMTYYGLELIFSRISRSRRIQFDLYECVLLMIIERLHDPCSKLGNYHNQEEYIGLTKLSLQHLYRSLDLLDDYSELIQRTIYNKGRNLFNQNLDVVFYDVTTFYFASDKDDTLRSKGFSKDGKQGKVQIVFGLLIDKNKQPIGYEVYRGDYFEGHSFTDALSMLKKRYQIDKVIVVADRGMLSNTNINLVADNGYEFIMGERLKVLPKAKQEYLINPKNYTQHWTYNKHGQQIKIKYCITEYKGRTIIGTWSKKRADKDKHDRDERIQKAATLINKPNQLNKKASRFFIKDDGTHQYKLDEDKIQRAQRYDGYLAISSTSKDLSAVLILDQYRHLYQVEHSFRTFKSHLETRPMFHWTEKRIRGHMCLCYISYTIHNFLQQKLQKQNIKLSDQALRKQLDKMQLSLIESQNKQFYIRSTNKEMINKIINTLGLKPIPPILPKSQIINYL